MTTGNLFSGLAFAVCVLLLMPLMSLHAAEVEEDDSDQTPVSVPPPGTRVDSVLVSVNGEPITLLDVFLETGGLEKEFAGFYSGERLRVETRSLRIKRLEDIVSRKLVYEKYKAQPFEIPRQEIENLLDEFVRINGFESRAAFEKSLAPFGVTPERLREQAREQIAVEVMMIRECDNQVNVTPKEVFEDYKAHPDKWTVPEKISLQLLQINVGAGSAGADPAAVARTVRAELDKDSSRKNFTRLVLERSDAASASEGGFMENAEFDKLRPEFIEALKDKKAGDVVGPIEAPEAFFFLRVDGIEPARLIPFSQANREARESLRKEKIAEKRKEYFETLRRDAVVDFFI